MLLEVTKAHAATYPDPIRFREGEAVEVGRMDEEFPGWFWCDVASGLEGWVHRSFLADTAAGMSRGVGDYSACELTVNGGERGNRIHRLDGWVWLVLEDGSEGWLPEDCVREVSA